MGLVSVPVEGAPAGDSPLDVLCLAPHPDDAELGMGGTLAVEAEGGKRVGVLDLSLGGMATNGSPEDRLRESGEASAILGLAWRGNLGLTDRALAGPDAVSALVGAIRALRPTIICLPHPDDPHPDHGASYHLGVEAIFSAGLRRYPGPEWSQPWPAFRPKRVLQYFINGWRDPALLVDVTAVYERKRGAIAAHRTQFTPAPDLGDGASTRLNTGAAVAQVESRDRYFGAGAGVGFAEGFLHVKPVLIRHLGVLHEGCPS